MKLVGFRLTWIVLLFWLNRPAFVTAQQPPAVDPDLAAAIEEDLAQQEGVQPEPIFPANQGPKTGSTTMNPKMSLILTSCLGWHTHRSHLEQGGHAPDSNGFTLQGLEFTASASVDPYFRFDLNFELSHLHIEEAYLTTLALPANLQARFGFFNAAFGKQNPLHLHRWKFVNPPLAHTRFMAEEHFSGLGAELSLLLPLPWYLVVLVQVFDTGTATPLRSSTFGSVNLTNSGRLDGPEDFVYVARMENFLALSKDWSLQLGISGAWGQSPWVPDNRATLYGLDAYLKWRPISVGKGYLALSLTLEYMLRDTQVPADSVRDHGGYAQLDIQWSKRFLAGIRFDNVDRARGKPSDPERSVAWQWRGSAVLTFLPTHFSKLRLQYDLGREFGLAQPVHAIFCQLEVSAGEHGAHRY